MDEKVPWLCTRGSRYILRTSPCSGLFARDVLINQYCVGQRAAEVQRSAAFQLLVFEVTLAA